MNPFDIFIIIVIIYCAVRGYFKGIILEISTILGIICGFYASYIYHSTLAMHIKKFLNSSPKTESYLPEWFLTAEFLNIVAFAFIFLLVILTVTNLGRLIKYLMKITFLGWIDRSIGVLFGFVKSVLILSVVLIIMTAFLSKDSTLIKDSHLSPIITESSEFMISIIPKNVKDSFNTRLNEVKKYWNKKRKTSSA